MRAKETLQLRHQLSASGLSLRAAAYDSTRHHVLAFDAHPQWPHVLRLFSLRRELKSVPLLTEETTGNQPPTSNLNPTEATQGHRRPSFFEVQLQQVQEELQKRLDPSRLEVVVPSLLLAYSTALDVFVCVYSKATRPKGTTKVPKTTTHCVVLLEPVTLRKLLVYQGPEMHSLQCAHYDPATDRVVLASHLKISRKGREQEGGGVLPSAPRNVVEILQLSKRLDGRQTSWPANLTEEQKQPKMLLLIENTRASLRHPGTLTLVCGSKGLRELYGATNDCLNSTDASSELLEWRQNQPNGGKYVLARRVMLQHKITSMTVSPCGDWLLVGFCKGGLRVWNVNGSRTNRSGLFSIDADPYEPTGSNVVDAQAKVISSIEIATTPTPNSTDNTATDVRSTDVIVITVERGTGAVRHWKFSVERKAFESGDDATHYGEHRYPRLSLVGYFDAGGKEQFGKEGGPKKFKNQDTLDPHLKTLTMCVTIDMGSCFENLLLVVREDVIHVLKVQTVLYVLQEYTSFEEACAVRAFGQQDSLQIISLSGTPACKLRIFPLDNASHQVSYKLLCVPPHALEISAHVCSMEIVTNDMKQIYFVVLAWSSGIVDVYDVQHDKRVMKLQDKQLIDQISTLSVVAFQHFTKCKDASAVNKASKARFWSERSSGDISQNDSSSSTADETFDKSNLHKTIIVVGTESGKLYGWNAKAIWDPESAFQSIQKADVRVQAAHSSHVIQLAGLDATVPGERALMASVGADGILKLWSVPSLKMIGYVNSIAEGYPATPSCIELMRGHKNIAITSNIKTGDLYVSVGYDDGRLAVWVVDIRHASFRRLELSTRHERRVTKICRISNDVIPTGSAEFLSCSHDMTVIQWEVLGQGGVKEKRYFDIGAPIVDMILVKEQAVVALAHEVCKFSFASSSKSNMKYLMKSGLEASSDAYKEPSEQQKPSVDADLPLAHDDYPDTPTTRSIEDSAEVTTPGRRTSRSVDEYLTLHVPSAVLHPESSSSSVIATDTATESAPATSEQEEDAFNEKTGKVPPCARGSKSTGNLHHPLINDDVLRAYLQEYIAHHGTGGGIAANRVTHFLALRPDLLSIKRPGFALAKSLKDLKLTAQTRVDPEEALQILRIMFTMSKTSNKCFDAPTMAHILNSKESTSEKARAQRLREKTQARRKPVVSYNLLGEKYVRWEEGPADEETKRNQSPSSPTNSLVVHTPPTPNMRDVCAFQDDSVSDGIEFFEPSSHDVASIIADTDGIVLDPDPARDTSRPLSEDISSESDKPDTTSSAELKQQGSLEEIEEEDDEKESEEGEEEDDNHNNYEDNSGDESDGTSDDQGRTNKASSEATQAINTVKEACGVKHAQGYRDPGISAMDALINSIRLSPMFQQFWTKGYCWCSPAPRLYMIWVDNEYAKEDKAQVTKRNLKCKACHKRLHTIELPRVGYAPHFSRQATFQIIVEVYKKLTATAHTRLYKNSSPRKERSSECSIFSALYEVFMASYGMRSAVELKLKLFFVSMCHWLPEYDAIAVFGELVGLHISDIADGYDQTPVTLTALTVCCYSWLYSRGMVVNGDSFSGRIRGRKWINCYQPAATEVIPATDGTKRWQFVRIEHALLCAQENLLYPLVSPGFLRNIMLLIEEYAQQAPTRSLRADSPDFANDYIGRHGSGSHVWIELHRFLRLLVGEWKHQNAQFRVVERLLFLHPQQNAEIEGDLLEKLRLMLSSFVFYDHDRVGAVAVSDFETLLFKLRYLWTEKETMALDSTHRVFDDAISATKKRFLDVNHDGQLCYLDFWVMLYIVGVKTRGLIHFYEIPSFCRDYRLEVSQELSDMVWNYMQLSCTLLLPKGLQVGKSSMDQNAERQHRRRVGGLHDGIFHFPTRLKGSLSTQELLNGDGIQRLGLFLDGSAPALRLTASTTALDRFGPVSVEAEFDSCNSSRRHGLEPVVVGVRPIGPTPKPIAPLRVSLMVNNDLLPDGDVVEGDNYAGVQHANIRQLNGISEEDSKSGYTNMYIQFPQVPPVRRRIGRNGTTSRQIVGMIPVEEEEGFAYESSVIEQGEQVQMEAPSPVKVAVTRTLSSRSVVFVPEVFQQEAIDVDRPEPVAQKPSLEKRRSLTAVVVVPIVDPEAPIPRVSSRHELLQQQSSGGLIRAVSERIRLEEATGQPEATKAETTPPPSRQSSPVNVVVIARQEFPPGTECGESQSVASSEKGTEITVAVADGEQPSELEEEFPQEEPNESIPTVVEEVPPERDPVKQVPIETDESVVMRPSPYEVVVESVVEPRAVIEDPPVQIVIAEIHAEVKAPLEAKVNSTPTLAPIEASIPTEKHVHEVDTEPDVAIEDELPEIAEDSQYTPPVIKQDDIQIHHTFRFSQQPTFIRSVAVANNPFRTAMWNLNDDSESDGDDAEAVMSAEARNMNTRKPEGFSADAPSYSSDAEYLAGLKARKSTERTTSASTKLPKTETTLETRGSSSHLIRLDSNFRPPHRNKREKQTNPLEFQFSDDLDAIQDEGDDDPCAIADVSLIPARRERLDEDAERALYGGHIVNALGEGIAFSPKAEAAMQQKWQHFFEDSESKMFAAMRNNLDKKKIEQQEAEERQRTLRKKWQEQRDQDLQRLQNSRQNSTLLMLTKQADATNNTTDASFRSQRIHRESCRQFTQELQFGVTVQRELKEAKETQFFHFYYLPEGHGSIITLKMHVLHGDAEVFMSTDTKVPCATDFMWRSSERMTKDSDEGHRIILYPHDLLKVVTAATANAAPTEQASTIVETNTSSASLRSFYSKQSDLSVGRVGFYLSVVALELGTEFTLAVMSSGQKVQPSRAIQTVDYLIDRFNMLSRSFQGHSTVPSASSDGSRTAMPSKDPMRSEVVNRQSSVDNEDDTGEGNSDEDGNFVEDESTTIPRRKTKKIAAAEVYPQELKSFQHLLETLSEKKGLGSPRAASILLAGPSEEHLEFVQDEDRRLQEMHRWLSHPRLCPDGLHNSISVVTERRLTLQGRRQKLRRVVATRLQHKLAPLRHKSTAVSELEKNASTGALVNVCVAKNDPRPVAYSITTLDPIPRSLRLKSDDCISVTNKTQHCSRER